MRQQEAYELAASILSSVFLLAVVAFVVVYAIGSPWRSGAVGRTIMYSKLSMAVLLLFIFTFRWLGLDSEVRQQVGTWLYGILVLAEIRMLFMLRYVQQGRVTIEKPNYTPIRDWIRRRRGRARKS